MKPTLTCMISLLSASLFFSTGAQAGSELSQKLKIIALQMEDGNDVLQLIVRRNIEFGEPSFAFNPAGCASTLIAAINPNGKNTYSAQYFNIPLDFMDHSEAEQRHLLNNSFVALISSRSVRLYVRDDICTDKGSRVVSGLRLQG